MARLIPRVLFMIVVLTFVNGFFVTVVTYINNPGATEFEDVNFVGLLFFQFAAFFILYLFWNQQAYHPAGG